MSDVRARLGAAAAAVERIVLGKHDTIELVFAALLARGHVLLEDVPGVGKTTLASAVAGVLGCSFVRIQFTSDLLPADLCGLGLPDGSGGFRFRPGPIFAQVVLADEINRTPPKTQGALLEAMHEGRVSADGQVHALPKPFFVLATQNPLEHHGTFPLPESQIDRFLLRLAVGYPGREFERALLRGAADPELPGPQTGAEDVAAAQEAVRSVKLDQVLEDWILDVVGATRSHPGIRLGVSPRGAIGLGRVARALAWLAGRNYVVPEDLARAARPALCHRIVPADATVGASADAEGLLSTILATHPLPR